MENKIIILLSDVLCVITILFVANDSDDNFRFLSIQNKKIIELKKTHELKKIISLQSV